MTAFAESVARLAAHGCAEGDGRPDGPPRGPGTEPPRAPDPEPRISASHGNRGGPLDGFIAAVGLVSRLCGALSAGLILTSMFIVCQMVFVRYVMNASTVWQTEAVIYMMIAATLVGLPYVQQIRGHVNVELFPMYLGRGPRMVLAVACLLVGMALCVIFGGYGLELVFEAKSGGWLSETVWAPPLWIPFLALPVGFLVLLAQFLADLLALVTGRDKPFGLDDGPADPANRRH